jgi:DNA-binding XRE family transcriptional regulator
MYNKTYIKGFNVCYIIQMIKNTHIHISNHTRRTLKTLAAMIAAARKERRMSQEELARRLGVSRLTVRSIENGSPTVAIGTVFEAAVIVGIPLLAEDKRELEQLATSVAAIAQVLPKTGRGKNRSVDDDF